MKTKSDAIPAVGSNGLLCFCGPNPYAGGAEINLTGHAN